MKCAKEGETLKKVSPFFIKKAMQAIIPGEPNSVKKLRDGTLLIETANNIQAEKLLKTDKLHDIPITVEIHRTLNTSRGVISHYDLLYVEVEEIKKEMASQGVIDCRRLTTKRNGEVINTTSVILTFALDKLPCKVFLGYESVPVRPFFPNPMRCFQCQKFGHIAPRCEGKNTCPRCGKDKHDGDKCTSEPHCVNCEGTHPAYSRDCPVMKDERKIMEIKILERIPYSEARKKYRSQMAPTFTKSFSQIVATSKSSCTISTQTENDLHIESAKIPIREPKNPAKQINKATEKKKTSKAVSPKKPTTSNSDDAGKRRDRTPPPIFSGDSQTDAMEEDLCVSDTEVFQARIKQRKNKLKR